MVAASNTIPTSLNFRIKAASLLPRSRRRDSWYRSYRALSWESLNGDVYLALIGSGPLQLSGFLVTAKSDINNIIAHCPVTIDRHDRKGSFKRLQEQLHVARKIAADPRAADTASDVISFTRLIQEGRQIPRWVYALACIPLSYPTDGAFRYPTPFCPSLAAALVPPR